MRTRRFGWLAVGATMALGSGLFQGCGSDDDGGDFVGAGGTDVDGSAGTGNDGGGSGGSSGAMGGSGGVVTGCGNSMVEDQEECDDGNQDGADGCENDCTFSCVAGDPGRDNCDDQNPCNGDESCNANHSCDAGTPLADGASCGTGVVCVGGACISASCGDGQTQSGEECDDGDVTPGNGCENDCTFSCVSTDSARDCSNSGADECAGTQSCDDATHTCGGTPLADNAPCNNGAGYCKAGTCTTAMCGNQQAEPGEDCDDGNTDDDDGCKANCTFTCTANAQCNDSNVCTRNVCGANTHRCTFPANTTQNGNNCTVAGVSGTCSNGVCAPANCGDSTVQSGEECDRGSLNGQTNSGCTAGCQFECDTNANCTDGNSCNGNETCVNVSGGAGKRCQSGTAQSQGTVCGSAPRRICDSMQACVVSTCGDGFVDSGRGEQCEPPNTASCDAQCHTISTPVCGNGTIETGEECDDGDTSNLDGCDSACKYEVFVRMNSVTLEKGMAPSFCSVTANRLGAALTSTAQTQINDALKAGIDDGSTNILVQALGLDDLTGIADPTFQLGITSGVLDPARGAWPGPNTIDWSFLLDASTLGANDIPSAQMNASLAARVLSAGPNDINMNLNLGGSPALLEILQGRVHGRTTTTTSVPAPPPATLAGGLTVFETITADASGDGLCGNVTVQSLAQIPVPEALTTGVGACGNCTGSKQYTYCGSGQPVGAGCNSLLDALVGGCRVVACFVNVITPTQPDVDNGAAGPTLTLGNGNKIPASQTGGNTDAYSAYFRFTARRQHATGKQ